MNSLQSDKILGGIFGVAIGDALGVPVEFKSRIALDEDPVTGFRAFGTHNQPAGTWSDDTSLTLCSLDALRNGIDYQKMANNFIAWYDVGLWTAHGKVFDIGLTTSQAISTLKSGATPELAGPISEDSNGNGSLMRMLPVAFRVAKLVEEERRRIAFEISAITHGHPRSKIACWLYCEIIRNILMDMWPEVAVDSAWEAVNNWQQSEGGNSQWGYLKRMTSKISGLDREEIRSSGYVIDSLEAAIYCLLKGEDFETTVLMAVNLGSDTDTVGAITGGLAGCLYGFSEIPKEFIARIARHDEIRNLCEDCCRILF